MGKGKKWEKAKRAGQAAGTAAAIGGSLIGTPSAIPNDYSNYASWNENQRRQSLNPARDASNRRGKPNSSETRRGKKPDRYTFTDAFSGKKPSKRQRSTW